MNFASKISFLLLVTTVVFAVTGGEVHRSFEQYEESDIERDLPLSNEYETCIRPRKCKPHLKCSKGQICVDPNKGW
uniref:DDH-Uro-1 n=1 Tax=Urodacus manicatus TaxID=1330407 RepID=T1DPA2_UROMN